MRIAETGRANRWLLRHLLVAGIAAIVAVTLFLLLDLSSSELWVEEEAGRKADGMLWRYNVATGSVALLLLGVTMSIGPMRVLGGRRRTPIHLPWRRVTGIWTAVFALLHLPGGLMIHSSGWKFWRPFVRIWPESGQLVDSFGVAYWAGLAALVVLIVLGGTSSDGWMRQLGARRWKRLHRLAYGAVGLVAGHSVAMQYAERRDLRHAALTGTALVVIVGLQVSGFIAVRRRAARPTAPGD